MQLVFNVFNVEQDCLVVDVGTSSMKAYLYNGRGEMLFSSSEGYQLDRQGMKVEIDASIVVEALNKIMTRTGIWLNLHAKSVQAVVLTSQRSSVVCVKKDGTLLGPVMMWQDQRAADICEKHNASDIFKRAGIVPKSIFSAPKIQWIRENCSKMYNETDKFVGFYELLIHELTGQWCTDDSIASRSCLMNLENGQWDAQLLYQFGIEEDKLCRIMPVGTVLDAAEKIQMLLKQVKPVKVILAGGDQQCAALGAGCLNPGTVQMNVGTGGYVLGMKAHDAIWKSEKVMYSRAVIYGELLVESSIPYCCSAIDRMCRILYGEKEGSIMQFFDEAGNGSEGTNGLSIIPEWFGDTGRLSDEAAEKQIKEWKKQYGVENVTRALLEGIAESLVQCAGEVVRECRKEPLDQLILGGGLSRSHLFCNLIAKQMNCRLLIPKEKNITAFGALLVGWHALDTTLSYENMWKKQMEKTGYIFVN